MTAIFMGMKVLLAALVLTVGAVAGIWVLVKVLKGLFWLLRRGFRGVGFLGRHAFRFGRGMVVDSLRFGGAIFTAMVILPLVALNFLLGRFSAAGHYGRALEDEFISALGSLYRVGLSHPVHFLGLGILTEGLEKRLPALVADAPRGRSLPTTKPGRFEGYRVSGELPPGGSGASLYLARPRREKVEALRAMGRIVPEQVVIKAFALGRGSTLPQIVRESRALEAANRMGLVLEHELTDQSFHYVMPFVPGDGLDVTIRAAHERGDAHGLRPRDLGVFLGYASDVLQTVDRFHAGGLWHKDIKPSNLIVSNDRVSLVDFGLVTPLASAMTLTTHGTEFYRDPEMVRLALQGVKVHEVDGVKFDIYSSGAVLYSMIENSFPAQGSLSRITKRCPEAVQWIIRKAMADMGTRYGSAQEMLQDLRVVLAARDPFRVKPAHLPSLGGQPVPAFPEAASLHEDPPYVPYPAPAAAQPVASWAERRAVAKAEKRAATVASRRPRSRGARRVLMFAGVCGALFMGSFFSLALMFHDQNLPRSHASRQHRPATVVVNRGGVRHIPSVPQETAEEALARRWMRQVDAKLGSGSGEGRAILMLDELLPTDEPLLQNALQQALESRGYLVLGSTSIQPEEEWTPEELELVASVRMAKGLGSPNDTEAVLRIEDFLDRQAFVEALVWLAPGDDEDEVVFRFIVPRTHAVESAGTFALTDGQWTYH